MSASWQSAAESLDDATFEGLKAERQNLIDGCVADRFDQLKQDLLGLLKLQGEGDGLTVEDKTDDLGFDWLILVGADFQDAIAAIHSAATSILEEGLGDLLLAVAFRFQREDRPEYWIYSYKTGTYYPFVPTGNHQRDNAEELRLAALAKTELPVEPTLERWYALWGIPV